ncbi:MAG: DNA repair protein RadA, partial [Acidimicrobiia bacterium]
MQYRCELCGYRSPKWMGFCPQCRGTEALQGEAGLGPAGKAAAPAALAEVVSTQVTRRPVGIGEVDRVLGGGIVPGAALLLGGEPGVGKSTLLLQMAGRVASSGVAVLVATAEESAEQVGLRARRLLVEEAGVYVLAERDVEAIIAAAAELGPGLLVVDSIQAVAADDVVGAPGGVAQVRECAARLLQFAKESSVPVIVVGHVTKEGGLAGPKLLEHIVDVVLYLEGDLERGFRVLRGLKNRFGATHQVGLFEMGGTGLSEVADPGAALVAGWQGGVPGSVVFPAIDGRRPLLVEVQALINEATTPQPRRSVKGIDSARVHQLLAVLDRHAGLSFAAKDVYVGVVGGIRVSEPAADLPVAVALASSL